MPSWKSLIGLRSAGSSTALLGRTTAKGYITVNVDQAALRKTIRALESLEPKIRKVVARKALRKWGRAVRDVARKGAYRNAERTKAQLTYKIKSYKHAVWCGVGVKTMRVRNPNERGRRDRYSHLVGWKSHFYEVGWTAWPKGVRGNAERAKQIVRNEQIRNRSGPVTEITVTRNGKEHTRRIRGRGVSVSKGSVAKGGRGWRKGLRNRRGVFQSQYARRYLWLAAKFGNAHAVRIISESVAESVRDIQQGKPA